MFEVINQGWFGSLVGILGLSVGLIGLLLYIKGRIGARPTCQMQSLRLLGKEEQALPPEVEIHFKSKNIPRLALTNIFLWNAGKESMQGTQIVQEDPLRCEFEPGDEILKAQVGACTRAVNKVALREPADKPHSVLVDFDYLDPGDGARIDILHTSKLRYPQLLGSVRGVPKGVKFLLASPAPPFHWSLHLVAAKRRLLYGMLSITMFLGLVSIILGCLPDPWLDGIKHTMKLGTERPPSNPISAFRFALIAVGCAYTLIPLLAMWLRRKKYPGALDPENDDKLSGQSDIAANARPPIHSEANRTSSALGSRR
jgi:hypothetical protein